MHRSAEEITERARSILSNPNVLSLVEKTASPTAAYDFVFDEFQDEEIAKAARWLAVLKRDYPNEYKQLTQTKSRPANGGRARYSKE